MFISAARWARDNGIPYRQVRSSLLRMYYQRPAGCDHVVDGTAMIQGRDQEARVLWSGSQHSYWIWEREDSPDEA